MQKDDPIYIVAGDEMQKLFQTRFPEIQTIPFREDLSKGDPCGFLLDEAFCAERASFWGVSKAEYCSKMSPIIGLDLARNYVLVFGEDACCTANLNFLIGYLKGRGYAKEIRVRIVNEYDLTILREYVAD